MVTLVASILHHLTPIGSGAIVPALVVTFGAQFLPLVVRRSESLIQHQMRQKRRGRGPRGNQREHGDQRP